MLKEEEQAIAFTLPDESGESVSLSDFLGRKVVLYFYPKDGTAGCKRQALAFAAVHEKFVKLGVSVIGISGDSVKSHLNFKTKNNLPFTLLFDTEKTVLNSYGVWQEKKLYGKTYFGTVRTTFIIDEKGSVEKVFEKANPDRNAEEVLQYLAQKEQS